MKFWTMILGLVTTAGSSMLAKWGLELSDETVKTIAYLVSGIFGVLLLGQGFTDMGKAAVQAQNAPAPAAPAEPVASSSSAIAKVSLLFLVACIAIGAGVVSVGGCAGSKANIIARQGATELYDCMVPEAKRVIAEVGPVIERGIRSTIQNDGTLDRAALKEQARSLKTPALRCAFQTGLATVGRVIAALAGAPQSEAQPIDREDAKKAFEEVSTELYGGAKFKIEGEVL